MHIFVTTPQLDHDSLILDDEAVVHQITRVLRLHQGEQCMVQSCGPTTTTRWTVALQTTDKKTVRTTILHTEQRQKNAVACTLAVALPNKRDKAEVIVQKATEIGVDSIMFFPSQRSVLRSCPEKKQERMADIMREAVEQSHGWWLPTLSFLPSLPAVMIPGSTLLCADGSAKTSLIAAASSITFPVTLLIGPEWGRSPQEIADVQEQWQLVGLWETVLRMETAAIVGAWILVQKNLPQHFGKGLC